MQKRIVCLANSYKTGGTCIAGKEVLANGYSGWIRPVSARPTAEVLPAESRYESFAVPKLLDVIDVPLLNPAPLHHQTENHVIDTTQRWVKAGVLPFGELARLLDQPASLWVNSQHTNPGHYDCISHLESTKIQDSLLLIRPDNFMVEIGRNHWTGRKTFRAKFEYKHTHYNLSVTDPVARNAFANREEGDYPLSDVYLCVSLTEPYEHDDRCHKLVAAIISNPPL
jgi:hypothetical protein